MRRGIKVVALAVLLCAVVFATACSANKTAPDAVTTTNTESNEVKPNQAVPIDITSDFTDPAFLAAVYEAVGKTAPEEIFSEDVAEIDTLYVFSKGIKSLAGLEHFSKLKSLYCGGNQLTSLPELPVSMCFLYCGRNQLTILPDLPSDLFGFDCGNNQLTSLPDLPDSLRQLHCGENLLTALPELPAGLEFLTVNNNKLTSLPKLPAKLRHLVCSDNQLTDLDVTGLPLEVFDCSNNKIDEIIGYISD